MFLIIFILISGQGIYKTTAPEDAVVLYVFMALDTV